MRNVRNISVDQEWLRLRLDWGDDMVTFFGQGIENGMYNPDDPDELYVHSFYIS